MRCLGKSLIQACDSSSSIWQTSQTCSAGTECSQADGSASCEAVSRKGCERDLDCPGGTCVSGSCLADHCNNGSLDRDELYIDCGGSCPYGCPDGRPCEGNQGCESGCCGVEGLCLAEGASGTCVCAEPRFTGSQCDECTDPKFTGQNCDQCADPKFTGKNCDQCTDSSFTGKNCDQCADPKFTGENCDQCADPKFTGLFCDQCVDAKFTGENCDQCTDPKFTGENCDVCTCPPKAGECNGSVLTTYAEGTCTNDGGAAKCDYAATETNCAFAGKICSNGQCLAAGDPKDYVFAPASSVLTSLAFGNVEDAEQCCFDFTGDGEVDNALGKLIKGLGSVLGDTKVNEEITENMQTGGLVILFNYQGLDDATADNSLTLNSFYGSDTNGDYTDNLAGKGDFTVDLDSFMAGTATPQAQFGGGSIANGKLTAGPGKFMLTFSLGDIKLKAAVSGTLMEADVTVGPNGTGLEFTNGKLGGYIKMDDLYAALNGYVTGSCSCLNLGGPLIGFDEAKGKMVCASNDASTCDQENEDEGICAQLGSFCGAALLFLKPDIDSDGDGEKDGMTVGAWINGTSANIIGLNSFPNPNDPGAGSCGSPGKNGAVNRCGQWDDSWPCNCDDMCAQYGDCCEDKEAVCG